MVKLGIRLSPILEEIELTLLEREANAPGFKCGFDDKALRAIVKIFSTILLEYCYKDSLRSNYTEQQRLDRAYALAVRIKQLVFEFTGMDSIELNRQL